MRTSISVISFLENDTPIQKMLIPFLVNIQIWIFYSISQKKYSFLVYSKVFFYVCGKYNNHEKINSYCNFQLFIQ